MMSLSDSGWSYASTIEPTRRSMREKSAAGASLIIKRVDGLARAAMRSVGFATRAAVLAKSIAAIACRTDIEIVIAASQATIFRDAKDVRKQLFARL
mmetsp:Transcript_8570/g.26799  ORF Transcript_8570/g.26799 Transcript_8570/m.26799 type:complete len:97 (+) Transcript_8570:458-748(+)